MDLMTAFRIVSVLCGRTRRPEQDISRLSLCLTVLTWSLADLASSRDVCLYPVT